MDLFNSFDIMAIHPARRVMMVQVTTMTNVSARRKKVDKVAELFPVKHTELVVAGWIGGQQTKYTRKQHGWDFKPTQCFKIYYYYAGEWHHDYDWLLFDMDHQDRQQEYAPTIDPTVFRSLAQAKCEGSS